MGRRETSGTPRRVTEEPGPSRALREPAIGEAPPKKEIGSVLLLGNYRPTLAVARSLAALGYPVLVGRGGGEGCTEYSRFVAGCWDHPPIAPRPEAFLGALLDLLARHSDIRVVFPVSEEFVDYLSRYREALPADVVLPIPDAETVHLCRDKLAMLSIAREADCSLLPFAIAQSHEELRDACRELGYPIVIRPLGATARLGHKKALIVDGPDELPRRLPRWPGGQDRLLLQRYASGERQDVFFAASKGAILRAMQVRYLRTDHADGTGLCVYGETQALDARLLDQCARLTEALRYTGIGCVQFVVDPATGESCFIELNPRISAIHRVTEAAGMELARLAIVLAGTEPPAPLSRDFTYAAGRRFAWTYGAIRGIKSGLAKREIGFARAAKWLLETLRAAVTADYHLTWSWSDTLPTLMLYLRQLPAAPVPLRNRRRSEIDSQGAAADGRRCAACAPR